MRADRLIDSFEAAEVDAMLITNLTNVRYLAGFTGSNGLVLIGPDLRAFVTDFRYSEQSAAEVTRGFERIVVSQDLVTAVPEVLTGRPGLRIGFESAHTSVQEYSRLQELLVAPHELVPVVGLVEELRLVKDPDELERIAAATRIADEALTALLESGVAGRTERELALALEHDMRLRGASAPSFDTIVAAGAHGALPHAQPRDVVIEPGQLVTFDWGAIYDGYCSDCTRTVSVGRAPEPAVEAYELVLRAQLAGLGAVVAGGSGREIDAVARAIIDDAGHAEHYGHGLGHGVGLEIHEAPRLSKLSTDTLTPGMVVTVEPGVYVPGEFGIRIEDLVVVGGTGRTNEVLTGLSKELTVVD